VQILVRRCTQRLLAPCSRGSVSHSCPHRARPPARDKCHCRSRACCR
jgi:hypothetical protein